MEELMEELTDDKFRTIAGKAASHETPSRWRRRFDKSVMPGKALKDGDVRAEDIDRCGMALSSATNTDGSPRNSNRQCLRSLDASS